MNLIIESLKVFFQSIGAFNPSSTVSYALYPFPYIEKTLTFDWDNIGTDITTIINKQGIKNNE